MTCWLGSLRITQLCFHQQMHNSATNPVTDIASSPPSSSQFLFINNLGLAGI